MYHDCLSPNYSSEWLQMKWNVSLKFPSCTPEYLSISFELTELIINICKEFNFNAEIEFTALELIDLFLMKSFVQLKNDLYMNSNKGVNRRNQMNMFKIQIRTKGFLYIICILSIVSKFINNYSASSTTITNNNWNNDGDIMMNVSMPLTTTNMQLFLQTTSYQFSKSQIRAAEYYVFKTIGFKFVCLFAFVAFVQAGGPAEYSISAVSGDHASVGNTHEHTVKGIHGQNVLSQYSNSVNSAHASSHVSSSRQSNDAYAPHYGGGYHGASAIAHHGYAPAIAHHATYAAPAIAHHATYAAPAIAHHAAYAAPAAVVSHHGFAAPAIGAHHAYGSHYDAGHGYANGYSHGYASPVVSYSHHQAAPAASYSHHGHGAYGGYAGYGGYAHSAAPIATHHAAYAAPLAYKAPLVAAPIAHTSFVGHGASYGW